MELNFQKMNGILPAVIQDASNYRVLMLGFMNEEAYHKTLKEKRVTFYSRSKNRLWTKGESSGNFLEVRDVIFDCDKDTLLIKVKPKGPVCHMGNETCFREDGAIMSNFSFLQELEEIINQRKGSPQENSYTAQLFREGINRIAQKVGEEAVELVIAAKESDEENFKNEAADLLFHFMLLLRQKNFTLADVEEVLKKRHRNK